MTTLFMIMLKYVLAIECVIEIDMLLLLCLGVL